MKVRLTGRRLLLIYVVLLAASFVAQLVWSPMGSGVVPPGSVRQTLTLPATTDQGVAAGRTFEISLLEWAATTPDGASGRVPVLLLHGSPGSADNFDTLGPLLAAEGRDVYALDMPGFGASSKWVPSYSTLAHARGVLEAMDGLGLDRAHVVGWSMGGGVGLHMADLAPERVATLTLLASIGSQVGEGSGDYYFEHAKYALGYAALVVAPEFVPHFGLMGPRWFRHSAIRNFWDTDMRRLEPIMATLDTPTLILHGRHDFLVHDWAAELHHELIPTSSLVMLDASHFMPWDQAEETTAHLGTFFARHDVAGVEPLTFTADYAPTFGAPKTDLGPFHLARDMHWWVVLGLIIVATFISEDATVIAVGVLISAGTVDWGVGLIGCLAGIIVGDGGLWALGRFAGRRALRLPFVGEWIPESSLDRWGRWFDKHTIKAVFVARAAPGLRLPTYIAAGMLSKKTHGFLFWAALAAFVWTPILLVLAILLGPKVMGFFEGVLSGPLALILSVVLIILLVRVINMCMTWAGRRRLLAHVQRVGRPEFWPSWVFYTPVAPVLLYQALRRGPMSFTCVNPGISHGGGVVGESKMEILSGLMNGPGAEWIVRTHFIKGGPTPEARAEMTAELVRNDPALGGYPVILKPDEAQRGHGLKLARREEDLLGYYRSMTRAALLQAFHAGPHEAGVLWARRGDGGLGESGRVFSVTRKEFPVLVGDGVSSLERLIWKHPRFRMQADTFLKRMSDRLDWTPEQGERVSLGVAGNHIQGAKLLDGADLITPEFEARFNEIAATFTSEKGGEGDGPGEFDFGRFDIRYEDDESLRRGEGFRIIELNGTMSESTNLYDPGRPLWWSYGVLARQWGTLYRLGALRRRSGVRPMGFMELLRTVRDHYRGRGGSEVAD